MAWNTPGSDNSGNSSGRPPRRRGTGNPVDAVLDQLRGLFGQGGGNGAAPSVLVRNHQVQCLGRGGQTVQVCLHLPDSAVHGQHGFKNSVPARCAQVGDHQLRPGSVRHPAVREGRVEENENRGSCRRHGSSLVRRRADKLGAVLRPETVRPELVVRGFLTCCGHFRLPVRHRRG